MPNDRVIVRNGEFHLMRDGRCFLLKETRISDIYTFEKDGKVEKCYFFM